MGRSGAGVCGGDIQPGPLGGGSWWEHGAAAHLEAAVPGICPAASATLCHSSVWCRLGTARPGARLSLPAQPHCSVPRCVPHGRCQCWHPEGRADTADCGADATPAHHQGGKCGNLTCPHATALGEGQGTPVQGWCTAPAAHLCLGSQDLKQQEFFLGWTKVSGKVDWKMLDEAVCQVFKVGTRGCHF